MTKGRAAAFGMFGLGLGYFLWYTPYSGLAKALSGGLVPGIDHSIGGLVILPAAAIGQLLAMPVFVLGSGWWKYSRRRRVFGRNIVFPARHTAESAFWMAFIVGSTTLNFTFPGASIVLMLVLMRIGNLIISPVRDLLRRQRIHWYSAAALGLSMISAIIALTDINNYTLTIGAVLSLTAYLGGYWFRFRIMGEHAKVGDVHHDRQYFIEEHMATPFFLLLILGVPALINQGPWMHALHEGFTQFLFTGEAFPAMLIGVLYEGLFILTSLIYLDPREFSFGMPVNVCAALLAGVVASIGLHAVFGAPMPSTAQFVSAGFVISAALILSYPTVTAWFARRSAGRRTKSRPPVLLFVCGGNTSRSPMAAALASAELANGHGPATWQVTSAGVSVEAPGAPLSPEAAVVLRELGIVPPNDHGSRALTAELCGNGTEAVYCMTSAQRDAVIAMAPDAAARTYCLDPQADVPDPAGEPVDAYRNCATRLQTLVRDRIEERRAAYALSGADSE